jgi:transposase
MKILLKLNEIEKVTLFELSINHPWRDARLRAAGLLMLDRGDHPTVIAQQCTVSQQTVYNWRNAWQSLGVVGLLGGHAGGRPPKLDEAWLNTIIELATNEALTLAEIARRAQAIHSTEFPLSLDRLGGILREHKFSFKRTRMSLKKTATKSASPPAPMTSRA